MMQLDKASCNFKRMGAMGPRARNRNAFHFVACYVMPHM